MTIWHRLWRWLRGQGDGPTATVTVSVREAEIPSGLVLQRGASAGYGTLVADDAEATEPVVPRLVARYSGNPREQRWAMITRIESGDATSTFEGMTASAEWVPWSSAHPTKRMLGDGGSSQVAWPTGSVVVWVATRGLDESELRAVVDAVEVNE